MVKLNNFNAHEIDPNDSTNPLPVGRYTVTITSTEEKRNKNGTGSYIEFRLEVLEGEYQGRKIYDRLNLVHENGDAVRKAKQSLSQICLAVGNPTPNDTQELHNIPLVAEVVLGTPTADGRVFNEVKKYLSREKAFQEQQEAQQQQQSQQPSESKPPWA